MAKIVSDFVDVRLVTYAESYWRLTNIVIDLNERRGVFTFSAFPSKVISETAKDTKIETVATVSASVSGDTFSSYYQLHLKARISLAAIAYKIADAQGLFKGAIDDPTEDVVALKK